MGGLLVIDPNHPTPIYVQIGQALRAAIANGRLKPGTQLPTVRQLAVELSVNANTVARVYLDLERAGALETRRGIGTFVAADPAPAPRRGRESDLRAIVQRGLDEAAAAGFTSDDFVRQARSLAGKQGG